MKLTINFDSKPLMPVVRPKQSTFLAKLLPTLPSISVVLSVGQYKEGSDNTILALITIIASNLLWLVAYLYQSKHYGKFLEQERASLKAYRDAVRRTLFDYVIQLPGISVKNLIIVSGTKRAAAVVIANVDKSIGDYISLAFTVENLSQKAREALSDDIHTKVRFSVETGAGQAIEDYMDTMKFDGLPTSIDFDPKLLIKYLLDRDLLVLELRH